MKTQQVVMLPVAALVPDPTQPRKQFDAEAEAGLAQSFQSVGQLVPVRVWKEGSRYYLEDGERRWRVAKRLGWKELAALVIGEGPPDQDKMLRQLVTACQREGLQPAERVQAIAALMQATGWNGAETARRLGMSEGQVSKCSAIAHGPAWLLELLASGKITLGVAYLIASEADVAKQAEMRDAALSGASRDALAGKKRREKKASGNGNGRAARRYVFPLPNGRAVSVSGVSDIEGLIEAYEETLGKLRKMRTQGVEIATATQMFRDQARKDDGEGGSLAGGVVSRR